MVAPAKSELLDELGAANRCGGLDEALERARALLDGGERDRAESWGGG